MALPLFLVAGVCLSSLDATAKFLVRDNALLLVVWARYAGQMLFVTPFAWRHAGPRFFRTQRIGLHLVRSTFLLLATVLFFGALRFLPIAEASAITFLAPIFIVLLSRPILNERPNRGRLAAAVAGFIGILIILRPGSAVFHPAALLLVGTALFNALYQLLTRKLFAENPHTSLFYSALVGAVVCTVALPFDVAANVPHWRDALLLLLCGVFAGLGHWFFISAYQRAPASLLTPFTYLQIMWATFYGWLIFGQLPDAWSVMGMLVIVCSGLSLALQERWRALRG